MPSPLRFRNRIPLLVPRVHSRISVLLPVKERSLFNLRTLAMDRTALSWRNIISSERGLFKNSSSFFPLFLKVSMVSNTTLGIDKGLQGNLLVESLYYSLWRMLALKSLTTVRILQARFPLLCRIRSRSSLTRDCFRGRSAGSFPAQRLVKPRR